MSSKDLLLQITISVALSLAICIPLDMWLLAVLP